MTQTQREFILQNHDHLHLSEIARKTNLHTGSIKYFCQSRGLNYISLGQGSVTRLTQEQQEYIVTHRLAMSINEMLNQIGTTYQTIYQFLINRGLDYKGMRHKPTPLTTNGEFFDVDARTNWIIEY